jgi:hypothetical protein
MTLRYSCSLLAFDALLHVDVSSADERAQGRIVYLQTGPELHVTHEPAAAFEQAAGIGKVGPAKKSDIDVCLENVGIGESRVIHTRGWMTVMQQFPDFGSALAHDLEQLQLYFPQITRMRAHPPPDRAI